MSGSSTAWRAPAFAVILAGVTGVCGDRAVNGEPGAPGVPKSPRFEKPQGALMADDFSRPGLAGWRADQNGVWKVVNGMLRAHLPDKPQQRSVLRAGGTGWTDYAVDVDVCMTRGVDKGFAVRVQEDDGVGVDLRGPGYDDVLLQRGWTRLGHAEVPNANGAWQHLRVEARGAQYRVFVNGRQLIEAEDGESDRGGIAMAAYTGGLGKCTVYYDNLVVTPLAAARR